MCLYARIVSLSDTRRHEGVYSKLYDEAGFNRFEQIQTVEEVIQVLDDPNFKAGIERILKGQKYTDEELRATIGFFSARSKTGRCTTTTIRHWLRRSID